jgi:hypothetical protein
MSKPGSTGSGSNSRGGTTGGSNAHGGTNNGAANTHGGMNNKGSNTAGGNANAHGGANAKGGNINGGAKGGANGHGPNGGAMNAKGGANGRGPNGAGMKGSHVAPGRQVSLKGGGSAHIRPNGQIRSVNRNGMHIEHGVRGGRTIVGNRNGARVVNMGRRGGYVQRPYVTRGGRSYYSRTYYYHGGYRTGVYRGSYYGGRPYYGYYSPYYYHPGYYGWAYNPWPAPAYYSWGWGGEPWYGYYGAYYQPYPVYPSAAFWLTDYLVAASLRAAYESQSEDNANNNNVANSDQLQASTNPGAPAASGPVALTPEVKQAIAEEVKAQLAAEQAESGKGNSGGGQAAPANSNEVPPALDPARRTFVVSTDLSVVADGEECALTSGDVITRLTDTPDDDNNVNASVAASKKNDCAAGKQVAVSVDDLQEMQNHFREQLTAGMGELAKKNGTGGLPKAPDTSTVAGDVPEPPADKTAAKTLQDQESAADQTEQDVKKEAADGGGGQ